MPFGGRADFSSVIACRFHGRMNSKRDACSIVSEESEGRDFREFPRREKEIPGNDKDDYC